MVMWNEAKEWFADYSEQVTLAIGGIGVVLSLAGIRLGLPFDLAWLAIIFNGLPIVWGAAEAMYKEFDVKADLLVSLALIAARWSLANTLQPQKLLSSCNWALCSKISLYLKHKRVLNVLLN